MRSSLLRISENVDTKNAKVRILKNVLRTNDSLFRERVFVYLCISNNLE
jgi:hypothetical protein